MEYLDATDTLCLHLNCSNDGDGEQEKVGGKEEVAKKLEDLVWRILGSEGRSEARMWLCTDMGSLRDVPRELQASIFLSLIRPDGHILDELLCRQTLHVACERQPRGVMQLFARDSKLIRNFFSGHTKRILDWFENFSNKQRKEKELGAQALARFAFIHREKFWKELEWKGTHGQAPATLASKPHYFLDLDVLKTVENFLDDVPEFWSSDELWDSLKEGELLSLDKEFFVKKLLQRMQDGSSSVWKMLEKFFLKEDFTHLCQRLLSFLDDQKLLQLMNKLGWGLMHASALEGGKTAENESWLVKALMMGAECPSVECAMVCNACVTHSRQLLRLVHDGESVEDSSSLNYLLQEMTNRTQQRHCPFWKDHLHWNRWELVKVLALESWAIHVLVLKECTPTASLRALLSANSIQFRQSSLYKRRKDRRARKERRSRKKKRRNAALSTDEEFDSGQSSSDSVDRRHVDSSGHWYLSLDNFNMSLEQDELPEQLSSFAFMQWLKWLT